VQLGDQIIRYDRKRTRKAYLMITEGAAKRGGGSTCRNCDAQRETAVPKSSSGSSTNLGSIIKKKRTLTNGVVRALAGTAVAGFTLLENSSEPANG